MQSCSCITERRQTGSFEQVWTECDLKAVAL